MREMVIYLSAKPGVVKETLLLFQLLWNNIERHQLATPELLAEFFEDDSQREEYIEDTIDALFERGDNIGNIRRCAAEVMLCSTSRSSHRLAAKIAEGREVLKTALRPPPVP